MKTKAFFLITTCLLAVVSLLFWDCNPNNMAEEKDDSPQVADTLEAVDNNENTGTLIINPCAKESIKSDTVIEFKDFLTKLYFKTADRNTGMRTTEVVFSNGLIASCNLSSGHPERFYGYYGSDIESSFVGDVNISIYHNGVGVEICNFPEKALSWNLKNLYRANGSIKYEGEVEIMISGVIYAEHVILENYPFLVLKYLELTSLTKLSVTTENN